MKHLLNISKKSYYNNYFHINNGNMKNIWKGIKELVPLKQSSITSPSTIEVDNTKITNSKQIANAFNEYFSTVGSDIANTIPTVNNSFQQYLNNIYALSNVTP